MRILSCSSFKKLLMPIVAVALSLGGGCSGGGLTTVKGKVTLDGNPMTKGSVRFVPDKAKGNNATTESAGTIGADGSYTLATAGKPGAPLGWYKVTIASGDIPESSRPNEVKTKIAPSFLSAELTPLSVEVVSSPKADSYDLKVTSK